MAGSEISFAYDAVASDIQQPALGIESPGFMGGAIMTNAELNYLLGHRDLLFLSCHDAANRMADGQQAQIPTLDTTVAPATAKAFNTSGRTAVLTTGQYVITQDTTGTAIYILKTSDMTLVGTITTGTTGTIRCTDGVRVIYSDAATFVRSYLLSDLSQEWNVAVAYRPLHCDGQRVLCSSGNNAYSLVANTGAAEWGPYNHNAAVRRLYSNGEQCFLIGAASGHASGATIRCIEAVSGSDLANEGGLGTSGFTWVWDVAPAGLTPGAGDLFLAYNGDWLYASGDTTGTHELFQINTYTGAVQTQVTRANPVSQLRADLHYVYASDPALDRIDVYTPNLDGPIFKYVPGTGANTIDDFDVDPEGVYLIEDPTASSRVSKYTKFGAQGSARVFKRQPSADYFWAWPNLIVHPLKQ